MNTKDYTRAANMIRNGQKFGRADRALLILFCVQFFADNPRFDAERFVKACQPEPRNVKKRDTLRAPPMRCVDCGEEGKPTGHQDCQYPGRMSVPN